MDIDPANPVVALCARGMQAEAEHRFDAAQLLFQQAWDAHRSSYEASIAAHFLARQQSTLEDALLWNQRALDAALNAPLDDTHDFLPSLYLNLAHAHEMLGQLDKAEHYLSLGESWVAELPDTAYAAVIRDGFARLRQRLRLGGSA
jgi:hypothetical protein